jgi:hypothetical protein
VIGLEGDVGIHGFQPPEIDLLVGENLAIGAVVGFCLLCRRLFSLPSARPRSDERSQILRQQVVGDEVRLQQQTFFAGVHRHRATHVASAHPARHVGQAPLGASMLDVAVQPVRRARRQRDAGDRE